VHPVEKLDDDSGEIVQYWRSVFVTDAGDIFATTSQHVPHKIQQMIDLLDNEQWKEGIKIRVTERKSRDPRRKSPYHDVTLEV
jgi:hypothetical protein